ncbi:mitochondrial chaperone BCS1 isoform X2 [Eurytemora carolleeae]|uniref:mitochondrial chaperone BCS1 isoform X2 n=1 Tax=Eurytemora carolleeae TaxID=1294199 RepID=UPI000C7686F3|nr:mitochondrial chaperone BCS1 isoform X2 [Eurytemora carolleeae]|eukprot:XP_023330537.1 mitochondrial chaperone BCS1-like isoform X2 [Eurytemora affinis]
MALAEVAVTLAQNPYFSAGIGLFGVGTAAALGRGLLQLSLALGRRHLVCSVQVPCNDKAYTWFLDWLGKEAGTTAQHISVRTEWEEEDGGRIRSTYCIEPSPGLHILRWRGVWIRLERVREQQQVDVIGGVPWETITLTTLGRRRSLLLQMLEEAKADVLTRHEGTTSMYHCTGSDWREMGGSPQLSRSIDTVVLQEGVVERLCTDCERFLSSAAWYRQRGIPHRRGILLHGPPGCGKTSLIVALAGHLKLGISTLSLADSHLTDNILQARLADVPRNTILLLEDIDAAFISRENSNNVNTAHGGLSQVTLTGLLNGLDGAVSSEGRLTFLTTNYPNRLDPALCRPGRIDLKQFIGYCGKSELERLFKKFYPETKDDICNKFSHLVLQENINISPAQVQAHLLIHHESPEEAIRNIQALFHL